MPRAPPALAAAAYYCKQGVCVEQGNLGEACTADAQCTSGRCVDGFCCNSQCSGQCEACDVTGQEGSCSAVDGVPHGTRPSCAGHDECAGACGGTHRAECSYPGVSVVCESACLGGSMTVSSCQGDGQRAGAHVVACAPYTCADGKNCRTTCTVDTDCVGAATCKSGKCQGLAPSGDAGTEPVEGGSGADAPALPPAPVEPDSDGGCGCRTAGSRSAPAASWLLLGLAAWMAAARRARRAR